MYAQSGEDGTVVYTLRRTPDDGAPTPSEEPPATIDAGDPEEPAAEPETPAPVDAPLAPAEDSSPAEASDIPADALPTDDIRDQIQRDRETLREIVSGQGADKEGGGRDDPELREISKRLPKLQSELKAVEAVEAAEEAPESEPAP